MVIYLKHPEHGAKVAITEEEAEVDIANGWERFDPTAKQTKKVNTLAEEPATEAPKPRRRKRTTQGE